MKAVGKGRQVVPVAKFYRFSLGSMLKKGRGLNKVVLSSKQVATEVQIHVFFKRNLDQAEVLKVS